MTQIFLTAKNKRTGLVEQLTQRTVYFAVKGDDGDIGTTSVGIQGFVHLPANADIEYKLNVRRNSVKRLKIARASISLLAIKR